MTLKVYMEHENAEISICIETRLARISKYFLKVMIVRNIIILKI